MLAVRRGPFFGATDSRSQDRKDGAGQVALGRPRQVVQSELFRARFDQQGRTRRRTPSPCGSACALAVCCAVRSSAIRTCPCRFFVAWRRKVPALQISECAAKLTLPNLPVTVEQQFKQACHEPGPFLWLQRTASEQDVGNLLIGESDRHREHPIASGREARRLCALWFWFG